MTRQEAIELIEPLLSEPVYLVDVEIAGGDKGPLLRIFLDTDAGITIDECMSWSRELDTVLEVNQAFPGRYTLEVSSPGLGRPLKHLRQYRKNIGQTLSLKVHREDELVSLEGELVNADEEYIELLIDGDAHQLRYSEISEAKVRIKW